MHRAFAVGANGKSSAYVFAVNDDGGLCGIAGHDGFGIGVVDDSFDLANMAELDGSRSLPLRAAPPILDNEKAGMGGNLAVKYVPSKSEARLAGFYQGMSVDLTFGPLWPGFSSQSSLHDVSAWERNQSRASLFSSHSIGDRR